MDSLWLKTTLRSKRITQRSLGDAIGLSQDKINKALAHVRQFSPIEAIKIADFLEKSGVSRAETLNAILGKDAVFLKVAESASGYQPTQQAAKQVPIIGTIGSLGEVTYFAAGTKEEFTDRVGGLSQNDSLVALRVLGSGLAPVYHNGDILYYDDHGNIDSRVLDKEAIVELQDGRKLLRIVKRSGMEGRYNLEAFHSPVMEFVPLKSASRILWAKKA